VVSSLNLVIRKDIEMRVYRCLTMIFFALLVPNNIYASELSAKNSDVTIEFTIEPTRSLKVTFESSVTLHSIVIRNNDGYLLNLDVQVPKDPGTIFYFNLPKLPPAKYLVRWKSQLNGGPISLGEATLTLNDDTYPRPSTKKPKYDILHRKLHG
jgi:hypothetical protein